MHCVIGIDGGATKTEVLALRPDGTELCRLSGDSSNPSSQNPRQAAANLGALLECMLEQPALQGREVLSVCMGLAGLITDRDRHYFDSYIRDFRSKRRMNFRFAIMSDIEIVLAGTLEQEHGIAVVAGTGSCVFGRTPDGAVYRTGGWGHLIGDEGSGYRIGLATLQSLAQSHDGLLPHTRLTWLLTEKCGISGIMELKDYIYDQAITKKDIAAFTEICVQASNEGDSVASDIIREAAGELVQTTLALIRKDRWFAASPVVMSGSIFKHSSLFRQTFTSQLQSEYNLLSFHLPRRKPVYGAGRIALSLLQGHRA
ncbi:N-acetylglucosamine kinase [Paenibacillus sp. J2TS4]|uniref:N-acetylglucosamine kinase n=1 Tax=Paenibacillus sp. J2TS4 TaxID=2807194 RepID=UPI001B228954|nr:BadF/BadG/BcrA/BcrD ATPase family protein [Paenibacillus sp. J2TS4]GIP31642.1 N-acetylmuramic acid/N-acetylglucosamine kinase [Paenibacillus sp. J2TS4]